MGCLGVAPALIAAGSSASFCGSLPVSASVSSPTDINNDTATPPEVITHVVLMLSHRATCFVEATRNGFGPADSAVSQKCRPETVLVRRLRLSRRECRPKTVLAPFVTNLAQRENFFRYFVQAPKSPDRSPPPPPSQPCTDAQMVHRCLFCLHRRSLICMISHSLTSDHILQMQNRKLT